MAIRPKKILCAVDFSADTRDVIRYGSGLATRFGARLVIFHAVYTPQDPLYGTMEYERGGARARRIRQAVERIEHLMAACPVPWAPEVCPGDPVDAVGRAACRIDADLVVAGRHGLSPWKRMLLGTVVERMARRIPRPLLVVRAPAAGDAAVVVDSPLEIETIVTACDFSGDMDVALAYAVGLAREFDARLHLFHAVESPVNEDLVDLTEAPYGRVQQLLENRLQQSLAALIPRSRQTGLTVETALIHGVPAEQLPAYAEQQAADLVIVGVRSHPRLEKLVAGSTTEAALRRLACPVMIVPVRRQKR